MEHKLRDLIHAMFLIIYLFINWNALFSTAISDMKYYGEMKVMGFGFTNFAAASWPLSFEVGSYKCILIRWDTYARN